MGTFFELGKDKAAKREGWAPPFISCAQDTMGLFPPLPRRLLGHGKPLPLPLRNKDASCIGYKAEEKQLAISLQRYGQLFFLSLVPNVYIKKISISQIRKSRKENPQKPTQLTSRSHPRHLVGKKDSTKDTIIDITSDSQVNSNFPNRWSQASLTFNNYFYLFLYLYIT